MLRSLLSVALRLVTFLALPLEAHAQNAPHVILAGGPALRSLESLRLEDHDHFWGNFIAASTLRMTLLRSEHGADSEIVWIVYRPSYLRRGAEDRESYVKNVQKMAVKYRAHLKWASSAAETIAALNALPDRSVRTFAYFGHSTRHAFLLEYSGEIQGISTAWIHESELSRLRKTIFHPRAQCQSWGCYTGLSMSKVWRRTLGIPLIGADKATNYSSVTLEQTLPTTKGNWVR